VETGVERAVTVAKVDRVKVEGVSELKAAFEQLGVEVSTRIGVRANREAARLLQSELIQAAPYDPREKKRAKNYGHLRDNIRIRRQRARNQGHITMNVTTGNAFWGNFLEFGTVRMPAQPWFRPIVESLRELLLGKQIGGLRDGIEREAKKAARIARRRR
jgi:HK97 gp10 family phage protein